MWLSGVLGEKTNGTPEDGVPLIVGDALHQVL